MGFRKVFYDDNNNQMDCYLNDKGNAYIGISDGDVNSTVGGYITLDKGDVKELIKVLTELDGQMEFDEDE